MEAKIRVLIGLQDCDTRMGEIKGTKERGPIEIQRLEDGFNVISNQLEEELNQLEAYKRERRRIEQDIEDLESHIQKSNIKLANIKSNKEYRAALKEINDLKTEKSFVEDKVIDLMEKIEALEERCVAIKTEREKLKEKLEKEREEILKELEALDQDLECLEKERIRFCQGIDEGLLRRYDYLREHKGGLAISPVIKGVCQTCHMGIPPQKFNELIRGNELMSCPNCTRIIYWGEDERFQGCFKKE